MPHIGQSRPDFGIGSQVKALHASPVVPSLGKGPLRGARAGPEFQVSPLLARSFGVPLLSDLATHQPAEVSLLQ